MNVCSNYRSCDLEKPVVYVTTLRRFGMYTVGKHEQALYHIVEPAVCYHTARDSGRHTTTLNHAMSVNTLQQFNFPRDANHCDIPYQPAHDTDTV
jgi:hypothetical protein